jgi:hypothetical protein
MSHQDVIEKIEVKDWKIRTWSRSNDAAVPSSEYPFPYPERKAPLFV